ncbi:MAG: hypothetical protein ACTSWQ_01520 [Candidatus Thorarchaeota archaeon]
MKREMIDRRCLIADLPQSHSYVWFKWRMYFEYLNEVSFEMDRPRPFTSWGVHSIQDLYEKEGCDKILDIPYVLGTIYKRGVLFETTKLFDKGYRYYRGLTDVIAMTKQFSQMSVTVIINMLGYRINLNPGSLVEVDMGRELPCWTPFSIMDKFDPNISTNGMLTQAFLTSCERLANSRTQIKEQQECIERLTPNTRFPWMDSSLTAYDRMRMVDESIHIALEKSLNEQTFGVEDHVRCRDYELELDRDRRIEAQEWEEFE